jgi:hypothetical protein
MPRRQSAFTAAGGSLGWRVGTLLVSVVAINQERNWLCHLISGTARRPRPAPPSVGREQADVSRVALRPRQGSFGQTQG